MTNPESRTPIESSQARYSLWQMVLYMLKLGALGFGGPVALVGYMRRDLVEQRGWITESDYKEGLALAQLAPGPMAAQTAIYLGYVHYRILGATLAGIAFVLPSFFMVVALGWAYQEFGGLTWMQAVFYGVGAAVIGIIAISAHKLTTKSVGKDKLLWAIFLTLAAVTVITESEIAWLFLAAGVVVWLWRAPPKRWFGGGMTAALPVDAPQASAWLASLDLSLLGQIGLFFAKAGAFVFGSGLAIVPFLYGGGGHRTPLAQGKAVRGCSGRCHDHARARGDHGGLYWLPGGRFPRCVRGGIGHVFAVLPVHHHSGPLERFHADHPLVLSAVQMQNGIPSD